MSHTEQVSNLKAELRVKYARYQSAKPDYGCGHELTKHISADYSEACRELNATLDQLAAIDPTTPKTRF